MRILFYPRNLDAGDSQRSAVELAGAMVAAGYDVTMLGGPGLLVERTHELGIDVVPILSGNCGCLLRSVRQLARVVRERDIDVIHAFEWESIAKAFMAAQLFRGHAAVTGTVHSRNSPTALPRTVPLLMGSRGAAVGLRTAGHTRVGVLEPWVDTLENNPADYGDIAELRKRWGFDGDGVLITVVTLPDGDPSIATLATVLDAVGDIAAQGVPVQLLVIGNGPRKVIVDERAAILNRQFGRIVVVAAGDVPDRRPAYAAADVIIGSDSSLLNGMAFGKPVVIEGERGYFREVNHATAEQFLWNGWYGSGSGTGSGKDELLNALEPLLGSSRLRDYRGAFSRELAQKYELDEAVPRQLQEYRDVLDTRVGRFSRWVDICRVAALLLLRRGLWNYQTRRHK